MITAYGTVENAVSAMQAGATNFIQKPWDNEKLLADVRAAVGRQPAEEENIQLKRALKQRYNFEHIVGKSEPMLKIFDLVAQVAPSRSTVLLQGESGTGKELIAKAIHLNSRGATSRLCPSTPGRRRPICSNPRCSDTSKAPLPARSLRRKACSKWPTGARSFSTRSAP